MLLGQSSSTHEGKAVTPHQVISWNSSLFGLHFAASLKPSLAFVQQEAEPELCPSQSWEHLERGVAQGWQMMLDVWCFQQRKSSQLSPPPALSPLTAAHPELTERDNPSQPELSSLEFHDVDPGKLPWILPTEVQAQQLVKSRCISYIMQLGAFCNSFRQRKTRYLIALAAAGSDSKWVGISGPARYIQSYSCFFSLTGSDVPVSSEAVKYEHVNSSNAEVSNLTPHQEEWEKWASPSTLPLSLWRV